MMMMIMTLLSTFLLSHIAVPIGSQSAGLALTLGYRPFLDPLDAYGAWFFLSIPLVFFVAMSYKALRVPTMRYYWRQVFKMTGQIVIALVLLSAALFILVEVALPFM